MIKIKNSAKELDIKSSSFFMIRYYRKMGIDIIKTLKEETMYEDRKCYVRQ